MTDNLLNYFKKGELSVGGYAGKLIDYTVDEQLLDEKTWALFVDQFRFHTDVGNDWKGEFWGKMMRGGCLTYSATKNGKLYNVLTGTVKDMLSVQERSGRFSSRPENDEFKFWDMWCRKYVLLGFEYYIDICKNEKLKRKIISAMKKHADYIIKKVGRGKNKTDILNTSAFHGAMNSCSILEPMVRLYGLTGVKRYLEFSEYIVSVGCCRDFDLLKTCAEGKTYPFEFPYRKAYEMMSCIEGALELYKYTGNAELLKAVRNFIDLIAETDYTIIGASGCLHEFLDNSFLTQTEPPKASLALETCVTVTFMKLCAKIYALTGDVKYVELIEKSGYNAMFGSVNNERQTMKTVIACVEDENGSKSYPPHEAFPFDSYSPVFSDRRGKGIGGFKLLGNGRSYGCCACIGSAGTAIFALCTIMREKGDFYVNLYNDATLKTDGVKIDMKANVYAGNGAKIKVFAGGKRFALYLRKPSWAEGFTISVNGEPIIFSEDKGYVKVEKEWNEDCLTVKYRQPIKMHVVNGKVAFTKGPITLARDARFGNVNAPLDIVVKDGKNVRARSVKNELFNSNSTVRVKTANGEITLCDYSQAGKNYDDENTLITVWQDVERK